MKKFFDIIIGTLFAVLFIVIPLPKHIIIEHWDYLMGISVGLGMAYCFGIWNKEKIEKLEKDKEKIEELEKEIKELKKKDK